MLGLSDFVRDTSADIKILSRGGHRLGAGRPGWRRRSERVVGPHESPLTWTSPTVRDKTDPLFSLLDSPHKQHHSLRGASIGRCAKRNP